MTNAKAIRQNTAVISNEERNLLFSLRCNEADYSPDEAGFDMTEEEFCIEVDHGAVPFEKIELRS